jgi:ABC-type multidrug transport system fused ATPase/permease subunit
VLPPFAREIRFEGVHFHHEKDKPTLHGVDLVIRKGEKVALVGPSGAGKTTFIDLVPRFFDVDAGRITVDGHDRARRAPEEPARADRDRLAGDRALPRLDPRQHRLRRARGHRARHHRGREVGQRSRLHPEDAARLRHARRRARLRLSGGERQRLAIARALLRDPPILILDEATSALDSESEAVVQAALLRLMKGRTVIVIAHRLSTVKDADRIVVLEKGRIVETGSHDELMARPDSLYRRHWLIQSRGHHADGDEKGKSG